jgi:uncharacterized protein YyaL (SSP411 family)
MHRVLISTVILAWLAVPAGAQTTMQQARLVTDSIQQTYWIPSQRLYRGKPDAKDVELMWGNGIMFSALVSAARHDPKSYQPVMSDFFDALDRYWDKKAPVPGYEPAPTQGGRDKYYDDNAWMVITYIEAFELTGDRKYLKQADATQKFVLSGWDDQLGGGIYWHEVKRGGKNTCSNAPTAVAAVLLARHLDRPTNLDWARRITEWTQKNLQDTDGLYFDSKKIPSGEIDKGKLTYNTALMLRANLGLFRATGEQKYLDEARRIGANCDWFLSKETGAYRDKAKWAHLQVEADLELYRMTGDEKALARAKKNGEVWFQRWQTTPPPELIEQASIARMLWLLADHETAVGQKFWKESDQRDSKKIAKH